MCIGLVDAAVLCTHTREDGRGSSFMALCAAMFSLCPSYRDDRALDMIALCTDPKKRDCCTQAVVVLQGPHMKIYGSRRSKSDLRTSWVVSEAPRTESMRCWPPLTGASSES